MGNNCIGCIYCISIRETYPYGMCILKRPPKIVNIRSHGCSKKEEKDNVKMQ